MDIFSVKDFSATTWDRILKFGTKLDSDKRIVLQKQSLINLISPSIWFRIMKLCVHFQISKVYCVNENLAANPHFNFFFQFFLLSLLYNTCGQFSSKFSQKLLDFVFSLKVLQLLMAIAGGMWALLTSCFCYFNNLGKSVTKLGVFTKTNEYHKASGGA